MDESEDMFADLEETLCNGLATLQFDRSVDPDNSEIDVSCLENVTDLSKVNGPAVRTYNLYKSTVAFNNKEYLDSIYFETFAMSLFMRIKFHANRIMEGEHHLPTEDNLAEFLQQKCEQRPEIIDYVDRFLNDRVLHGMKHLKSIEFESGTELMRLCSQLPNEWTVVQLCKGVNNEIYRQSREEVLRQPCVIFLTLFCYPMSERFDHQPIKIALNQKDLQELYDSAHKIHTTLNGLSYRASSAITTAVFNETIVSKLKKLLGPWIVCFSGKSKSFSDDSEILDKVDEYLAQTEHEFSKRQQMLICLIARRVCLLTKENIKDGALFISKTKFEFWDLQDFFEELKLICKVGHDTYPVILVVDETINGHQPFNRIHLWYCHFNCLIAIVSSQFSNNQKQISRLEQHIDFMFWEMCNLDQEFTRVDSMVALLKLFFHHQDNISNGYFNVKGRKASAVMNPDRTLPDCESRVRPLLDILPSTRFNFLIDKKPTFSDLKSMLANSDVYIYNGHGSGMQFISSYETCQLSTNAVVFLMGCSSVAMKSHFGYCLATAPQHYYHIAKSPAVIGFLTTVFETDLSVLLSIMMAKWFSNVTDFKVNIFNASNRWIAETLKESLAGSGTNSIAYSPHLSNVICQLRKMSKIPVGFRAILCHRGLPVQMV